MLQFGQNFPCLVLFPYHGIDNPKCSFVARAISRKGNSTLCLCHSHLRHTLPSVSDREEPMCSTEGWIHLSGLYELIDRVIVLSGEVVSRSEMKVDGQLERVKVQGLPCFGLSFFKQACARYEWLYE